MIHVAVLAYENCLVSGVVGPIEIFSIANSIVEGCGAGSKPLFTGLDIVSSDGANVKGFSGIPLAVGSGIFDISPDILILPPVFGAIDPLLEDKALLNRLAELNGNGTVLASSCAGSFLLAKAGILKGKPATTHWKLADDFARRFKDVDLQARQMLIDGGSYICAGGAMAWQDLALHIVARFMGRDTASDCAKILVMDSTRTVQTPYFMFDHQLESSDFTDQNISDVQNWMQDNYSLPLNIELLAGRAGLGVRTFLRRFKRVTGMTPNAYLQQLRIEAARHILEVSSKGIEEITVMIGYENPSSFRRLFKRKTGVSPREYRAIFSRIK